MPEASSNVVNVKLLNNRFKALLITLALIQSSILLTSPANAEEYDGSNGTINCSTGTVSIVENVVTSQSGCIGALVIPGGVTSIGRLAFSSATALTSITIPSSVTGIGQAAFAYATNLQTVNFSQDSQLTTFGDSAFEEATALTSVTIPAGVTSIGQLAFRDTGLTKITIPSSVTGIGKGAFASTTRLTTVVFESSIRLTSIGEEVFNGATALKGITIPSSVTTIGDGAFGATGLTGISIPSTVTSIGDGAFINTASLKRVTFSGTSNLRTIAGSTFDGATLLTSITIPASVRSIGDYAFTNTRSLKSVIFLGNAPSVGQCVFCGINSAAKAYIPIRATGFTGIENGYWNFLRITKQEKAKSSVKPAVSGKAQINKTLTATKGNWTGAPAPEYSYQWYYCTAQVNTATQTIPKNCKTVSKATKSTFVITSALEGKYLAVAVTGTSTGTSVTKWLSKSTAKVK
jgi:hypothetical protein